MDKADNGGQKIREFTDLRVWQRGHELVILIYKMTKRFPKEETYSLIDQMRRSAMSITANIAEGFGRQGYREKIRFYYLSQGSLTELKDQILVARDVGYINTQEFSNIIDCLSSVHGLLQGIIKKSKTFLNPPS